VNGVFILWNKNVRTQNRNRLSIPNFFNRFSQNLLWVKRYWNKERCATYRYFSFKIIFIGGKDQFFKWILSSKQRKNFSFCLIFAQIVNSEKKASHHCFQFLLEYQGYKNPFKIYGINLQINYKISLKNKP